MRPGKPVTYTDAAGAAHPAVVAAVVGASASGFKVLDLTLSCTTEHSEIPSVVYVADAPTGAEHWTLPAPDGSAHVESAAALDVSAVPSVPAPEATPANHPLDIPPHDGFPEPHE